MEFNSGFKGLSLGQYRNRLDFGDEQHDFLRAELFRDLQERQ